MNTEKIEITPTEIDWVTRNSLYFAELHEVKASACKSLHEGFKQGNYAIDQTQTSVLFEMVQLQIIDLKFRISFYERQQDQLKYKQYKVRAKETLEMLLALRSKLLPEKFVQSEGENKNEQPTTDAVLQSATTTATADAGTGSGTTAAADVLQQPTASSSAATG